MDDFTTQPAAIRRNANRSASSFDAVSVLHREVGARMQERLDYIKLTPKRLLDLGCANGGALSGLAERFPAAELVALDFAQARVARATSQRSTLARGLAKLTGKGVQHGVCATMQALPLANQSVSMVWSNLALHWLHDPGPAIAEAWRVLEPGGLLMFSTLGPDTLAELRRAAPQRVHRFIDLHDIGDLLVSTRFATPVMDMERITLTYQSPAQFFTDLRHSGSTNAMIGRPRGLMGRARSARQSQLLAQQCAVDGRISAGFEVIYGHAWKLAPQARATEQTIHWTPRRA